GGHAAGAEGNRRHDRPGGGGGRTRADTRLPGPAADGAAAVAAGPVAGRAARRLPHALGLVRWRQPAPGDGRDGPRPRARLDRADRPLAPADLGLWAVGRAPRGSATAGRRALM